MNDEPPMHSPSHNDEAISTTLANAIDARRASTAQRERLWRGIRRGTATATLLVGLGALGLALRATSDPEPPGAADSTGNPVTSDPAAAAPLDPQPVAANDDGQPLIRAATGQGGVRRVTVSWRTVSPGPITVRIERVGPARMVKKRVNIDVNPAADRRGTVTFRGIPQGTYRWSIIGAKEGRILAGKVQVRAPEPPPEDDPPPEYTPPPDDSSTETPPPTDNNDTDDNTGQNSPPKNDNNDSPPDNGPKGEDDKPPAHPQ